MKIYLDEIRDFRPWYSAVETWDKICNAGKVEEFEAQLELIYPEGMTVTELNDYLRFESEQALKLVGLSEDEEDEDDDGCDEEEEEDCYDDDEEDE